MSLKQIKRLCLLPENQSFFLFGPRGTGKSTLIESHFSQYHSDDILWIDLLNQKMELSLHQNPDSLLDQWKIKKQQWIVIDEVQKIPALLDVVHSGIEKHKIKFALTGSSARKLKRGGANLLAGRAVERELSSFSAIELGDYFNLERAMNFGLLPKLWSREKKLLLSDDEKTDFLYAYVNTYLKEEIAAEQLVRNLDPFRRFLVSAAQSDGRIINHAAIERDSGITKKQSERHFEILVDTLIGRFLPPFHLSVRKRQTLKSKFYFFDLGIVRTLQNITGFPPDTGTYGYGNFFENLVINEFFKLNAGLKKRWEFSYLRTDQESHEIDLIIERPRAKPILVEIKSTNKFLKSSSETLFRVKNDIPHECAYVLSNDPVDREFDGVRCMHWLNGIKEIFGL